MDLDDNVSQFYRYERITFHPRGGESKRATAPLSEAMWRKCNGLLEDVKMYEHCDRQ